MPEAPYRIRYSAGIFDDCVFETDDEDEFLNQLVAFFEAYDDSYRVRSIRMFDATARLHWRTW
jgi:hypothetical protein